MIPVIALVGRPNVGKSMLFNRLTKTRDALVADFPGLTRDRKYGKAHINGYEYIVVDTGGLDGFEEGVENQMAEQSLFAIEEADIVLFMVDARAGVMLADYNIAQHLRKRQKTTVLVANKIDGLDADIVTGDFYALGMGNVHPIAASHGRGVASLMEQVLYPLLGLDEDVKITRTIEDEDQLVERSDEELEQEQIAFSDLPIKVGIVGRPNVGKSTLINRILGENRVVVYDMPGTTRDSIYIPMEREGRDYILIDTAGVRKRSKLIQAVEKFSVIKTLQSIEEANVVLLVIDARQGVADQDLSLLGFIVNSGRSLVIVVNKWDGLSTEIKEQVKSSLDEQLGFIDFARIHFISALHGSGVGDLFKSINEAYKCATKRVNTALLTKIMQMAQDDHQPPLVKGRRIKLKYAHAGGYNPPIVVIHGNQVEDLPDAYKRYLINYYRRALHMVGTPIRLQFKQSENPYDGRKNILSVSQLRKRRRLIKYVKKRK